MVSVQPVDITFHFAFSEGVLTLRPAPLLKTEKEWEEKFRQMFGISLPLWLLLHPVVAMGGPASPTSTWPTQPKPVPHLGQCLHQVVRGCVFEVPVQELAATLSFTVIPNSRGTAKCVVTSLDTNLEIHPYRSSGYSIDTYYIDGISVTNGQSPRQHIWTFAAGYSKVDDYGSCPCGSPTCRATIPPYVGNDYFCETGAISSAQSSTFYPNDPL